MASTVPADLRLVKETKKAEGEYILMTGACNPPKADTEK
jgi:hypothetical protein